MNRYERYKDSGIPWLGEVPAHWNVVKLQYLISCTSGDALPSSFIYKDKDDGNSIPVIGGNGLFGYTTNSNFIGNCLSVGRVGALCGNIHYIDYPSWINDNALIVRLISDQIILEFLEYILISRNLNELASKTAQPLLTGTQVKYEKIVVPPTDEQTAIAHYLDTKLGEIDALIDKQQTLLEKLSEQRTAVITHAVTKGLNPAAPMKNRGVEWLGDVPAHWVVMPVKFSLAMPITDGPHETPEILSDGIPFISAEAVKNDKLDFNKKRGYISEADNQRFSKKYSPLKGDIYMVKSGATTGNVAKVETDEVFNIWSPLAVMRPDKNKISTDFLFYAIKSNYFNTSVQLKWNMGTQQNIGMGILSNIRIFVPPTNEQAAIADYLDQETAKIDRLCDTVNQTIGRLKEYRTALITQAVTGKIKVTDE